MARAATANQRGGAERAAELRGRCAAPQRPRPQLSPAGWRRLKPPRKCRCHPQRATPELSQLGWPLQLNLKSPFPLRNEKPTKKCSRTPNGCLHRKGTCGHETWSRSPFHPPNFNRNIFWEEMECSAVDVATYLVSTCSRGMVHPVGSTEQDMKQWHGLPRIAIGVTFMFKRASDLESWCNITACHRMLLLTPAISNRSTDILYCTEPDEGVGWVGQRFLQTCSAASSKQRD